MYAYTQVRQCQGCHRIFMCHMSVWGKALDCRDCRGSIIELPEPVHGLAWASYVMGGSPAMAATLVDLGYPAPPEDQGSVD